MNLKTAAMGAVVVFAGARLAMAESGLRNTPHNFSASAPAPFASDNAKWNSLAGNGTNAMEICYPCHTPHNANATVGYLWNHALSDPSKLTFAATNYTLFANGKSMMCLGCHDGVTALDAYGPNGTNGTVTMASVNPAMAIGPDLSNDHPIGVDYGGAQLARTNSFAPITWTGTTKAVVKSTTLPVGPISLSLEIGPDGLARIGCETCHTAHDNTYGYFLRANNSGSAICITCHGTKWDGVPSH